MAKLTPWRRWWCLYPTSKKAPTDGIEADVRAAADVGTIAAPVSADIDASFCSRASQKKDFTSTKAPTNGIEEATKLLDQTQSVSTKIPTYGIEAPPASPGRELCHISEWYHRVQFVEEDEGQREHPPLKTPAPAQAEKQPLQQPHKEAQESKHSP